jgi:ABC-2 type transport system ATP-binding protein
VRELRVDYGDLVAVDDFSLDVPPGEVFGIVGPNGAGKTSAFRVLATLMEPTYGEVELAGIDALESPEEARRVMGYMPDLAPVPSDLKAWEFLDFHADTHGIGPKPVRAERVEECLETVHLREKRDAWCRELSRGQTQRLVLAKTLLHRPRVLILDEPASGLDPLSRRELRLTLQGLARDGATIVVSSHILSELAELCTSLCVMDRGRLLAAGAAEHVRSKLGRAGRSIAVRVLGDGAAAAAWLESRPGVSGGVEVRAGGIVAFAFDGSHDEQAGLVAGLVAEGVRILAFEEKVSSFEDILVEVAEEARRGGAA